MLLFVLAALALSSALPVEEGKSSPPSALVGSLDQSAESSEVRSANVELPAEYDSGSELINSEEQVSSASHGFPERSIELQGGHQTFFPSFASLFEPRQPLIRYQNQEGAYSQRPNSYRSLLNYPLFGGYRNLENFGKPTTHAALVDASSSILGSGNFGVIKGGTFAAQNEEGDFDSDSFSSFYNNGHGRPLGYIPNPRPNYNQDQFANFRDFADINAPADPAYSHFLVVYANKNATVEEVREKTRLASEPKNIMETLQLLDRAEAPMREPKISKVKAKLAKSKMPEKKQKWKKVNQEKQELLEEPLLATS